PRAVTVHRFDVGAGPEPGVLRIDVTCSSGTYVRSLAADLGRALGGGAHLRNLRRTAVGSFTEADLHDLDSLEVLSPADALRDYDRVTVDADTARLVGFGRPLPRFDGEGPWALVDGDGNLLAMYDAHGDQAKPAVVIA